VQEAGKGADVDRAERDAQLVVRAQLGDRQALGDLVERWHLPVWRYVRRMLDGPGPADDVSQEVWAAALRGLPRLQQPDRFAPWLLTIARRAVLNRVREKYGTPEPAELDTDTVSADESADVVDRVEIAAGLAALPVREREVLVLFYLHDLGLEECGQILEIPPGTVKSRLFRARRMLREQMTRQGYRS
jgi:RNA polymerase sigma-70 factor (ECF subfamily)